MEENADKTLAFEKTEPANLCKKCSHFNVCALKDSFLDAEIAVKASCLSYKDIVEPFDVKCKYFRNEEIVLRGTNRQ